MNSVAKVLSANDVSETGSHQAGILIPKSNISLMEFFPKLDVAQKNPRTLLEFEDKKTRRKIYLNYIYYNNKYFRNSNGAFGTRNEYRLTGLTAYFKGESAKEGDVIEFSRIGNKYFIEVVSGRVVPKNRITLKGNWLAND